VKAFDALDVALMMAYNDLLATFGCNLGADVLSDDPLVPEIVGILVRGENVALLHADRLEQTFGIAHDLFARRTFFLSGRDDLVASWIAAALGQRRKRFHSDRCRLHGHDAA
jgi:hypothetical protein